MSKYISAFCVHYEGFNDSLIEVQGQFAPGLPNIVIVGYADKSIAESKEKIRSILYHLNIALPPRKIIINLAPSAFHKSGSHYDLSITICLLSLIGIIPEREVSKYLLFGELGLDGSIRSTNGFLLSGLCSAKNNKDLIVPSSVASDIAAINRKSLVFGAENIAHVISHMCDRQVLSIASPKSIKHYLPQDRANAIYSFSLIKGQQIAKRALLLAAAGGHHMLLIGPPGSGKSMLASSLIHFLPEMNDREYIEVSMIHSLFANDSTYSSRQRPLRKPHSSATSVSLTGGGFPIKPGEISLAHRGVLFLDEVLEFSSHTLDVLREPIETGKIILSRANSYVEYPSRFQLICTTNPCKCGYFGTKKECQCSSQSVYQYRRKLSGALIDRIDIQVYVDAVDFDDLYSSSSHDISAKEYIKAYENILNARRRQRKRNKQWNFCSNANIPIHELTDFLKKEKSIYNLLSKAFDKNYITARSYHSILRLALTIADFDNSDHIYEDHVYESIGLKSQWSVL